MIDPLLTIIAGCRAIQGSWLPTHSNRDISPETCVLADRTLIVDDAVIVLQRRLAIAAELIGKAALHNHCIRIGSSFDQARKVTNRGTILSRFKQNLNSIDEMTGRLRLKPYRL